MTMLLTPALTLAACGGCRPSDQTRTAVRTATASPMPRPTATPEVPGAEGEGLPDGASLPSGEVDGDCIVLIDAVPDFGEPPLTAQFSVEAHCTGGTPAYTWTFGDGSAPSSEAAPAHVYENTGEYTVRLQAVAPDGARASDEMDILVEESPLE
jgi:hypothetical protein